MEWGWSGIGRRKFGDGPGGVDFFPANMKELSAAPPDALRSLILCIKVNLFE